MDWSKGKRKKYGKLLMVTAILFSFCISACSKPVEKPAEVQEETDWRDRYGLTAGGTVTLEPDKPTGTAKPAEQKDPLKDLPYPTTIPKREFVPEEGQTELVLWLFGQHERYLDDHILAELNHILQERGCSFYLSKRIEPVEVRVGQISLWQEALDAGETVDLIFLGSEDIGLAYKKYGNTAVLRAITGGYLLPFSEYPETEAKERLLSAYPEDYWRLCSFRGENYGVSNSVSNYCIKQKACLMLNLDAAEQAGIEIPEELDILNLDELLKQAEEAGIPGMSSSVSELDYCGLEPLDSGLYVKYLQDGKYKIVNPVEDEELLTLWDTQYRYKEKGWGGFDYYSAGELPLILHEYVSDKNWDGERFYARSEEGTISARVKIYEEAERFLVEADYNQMLGISTSSRHKEEALELLSLMHGDEEIVQLLRYGIEGVHYRIGEDGLEDVTSCEIVEHEHGRGIRTGTWRAPGERSFGNCLMYVGLDERLGKIKPEEWYGDLSDIELIPYLEEFTEEQREVQKKVREVTYLVSVNGNGISDIATYLILLKPDYQAQIEKLRTVFSEAGYNELAKEVNEAYGLE